MIAHLSVEGGFGPATAQDLEHGQRQGVGPLGVRDMGLPCIVVRGYPNVKE